MTPLDVLLSHALLDLTRACEREGATEVVLWSNLLRAIDDDCIGPRDLPSRVRLSKRAVKSTLTCADRRGWVSVEAGVVRLTEGGRKAREDGGQAIAAAESAWPGAAALRAPLESFVTELPLEHPHYPCGYGTADWRITGGPGVDWKPVFRDPKADTVSSASLLALLSQALVGFTVEYESRTPFALLVGVHFDESFAEDSLALADAPSALRIKGDGKSSLERHGAVTVESSRVMLTPIGRSVRDNYRPTVTAVESGMHAAPALRTALEGLAPDLDAHAPHPDVHWIGGDVGFSEVSAHT